MMQSFREMMYDLKDIDMVLKADIDRGVITTWSSVSSNLELDRTS